MLPIVKNLGGRIPLESSYYTETSGASFISTSHS